MTQSFLLCSLTARKKSRGDKNWHPLKTLTVIVLDTLNLDDSESLYSS